MRHAAWSMTVLALGVAVTPVLATAQSGTGEAGRSIVEPGSTVRLFTADGSQRVEGVLLAPTAGAWRVRTEERGIVELTPSDVTRAELRRTRSRLVPGVLTGMALGLVAGSISHVARSGAEGGCLVPGASCSSSVDDPSALTSFVLIPAAGAFLGGVVGAQRTSTQWVPAVVPGRDGSAWTAAWSLELGG